jgi:hypothetical protein
MRNAPGNAPGRHAPLIRRDREMRHEFTKLRVLGFKSFVEPTEFIIERGLTGVVGPNGCGKSNLVEAMRWVMGENSYKNMRASGMDDVIFLGLRQPPGAQHRRSRLFLDKPTAPRPLPSTMPTRSRSPAASSANPARSTASTARKPAPRTCSFCLPTPPPARVRPRWSGRAASVN